MAVALEIGADGFVLGVALALVTAALWPEAGRLALLVPGCVLLWLALPARAPFVVRPPAPVEKPTRRKD